MDLVVVSNSKGEVALHRLLWLKAWDLPPPTEKCKVTAMAWRPDGKVLAIGYTGGELILINVENKSILHTLQVSGEITCVNWVQEKKIETTNIKATSTSEEEANNYTQYVDYSKHFISKPLSLSTFETGNFVEEANNNLLHKQKLLNLLLIGTDDGMLYLSVFGSLSCGAIDFKEKINTKCSVIDVQLSESLNIATVTLKDIEDNIKLVFIDTAIFESHIKELFCVAMKKVEMQTHVGYLYKSISSVMETWESILLEMDWKLTNYANKVQPGTLSADFLDLLMFGICSDEMQEFLFSDMTKRGLEKFGQNIEMNYANIQKILLKNITKLGQNITYHLSELRGMSRFASRYKTLGLEESKITEAISANGAFLIKSGEMQQIINNSMMYYKAFFRWLYSAIVNLMEEQVPSEIQNMTQQDLAYIAEFLQCFDRITGQNNSTIGGVENPRFIMERLGQYLADRNLKILTAGDQHDWDSLLLNNECLQKHPSIIRHCKELSLVQQIAHLQKAVDEIFKKPEVEVTKNMNSIKILSCIKGVGVGTVAGISCTGTGSVFMHAFPNLERNGVYFIECKVNNVEDNEVIAKGALVYVKQDGDVENGRYNITDVKFYSENVLSLLLEDKAQQAVLMQLPIVSFKEKLEEISLDDEIFQQNIVNVDVSDASPLKNIAMTACKFAVSGCRSVSVVLADNKKKVMLFEIEGEEEEEEDADMTTSSVRESDQDASMQENSDAE